MGIKNAFLQAIASKPLLEVKIEEYNMTCYIGKLSAGERAEVLAATRLTDGEVSNAVSIQDQMCVTLRAALREADGSRAFQNTEEDLQVIRDMDGAVVATLFEQVVDFNGLGDKAVATALKNSDASRN
jgi:hypothetical protein